MNHTEATILCRYVRAACPQQAIDEYTPDVWADLLGGVRLTDAKTAVRNVTARQPFVAPSEILDEVHRIRNDRITRHPEPVPPADLDPVETQDWLRAARKQIGDGETLADATAQLPTRDMSQMALVKRIDAA